MKTIKVTLIMKIDELYSGDFVLDSVRDCLQPGEDVLGFQVQHIENLEDVRELLVKE